MKELKKSSDGKLNTKPSSWNEVDREMAAATGFSYGQIKLRGKYNRLKMMYNSFSALLSHTGVTFIPATNTVSACEDTWKNYFAKHPKFKCFKKSGCKHYELMAEVFCTSVATGGLARSSSQMPPNSDDEQFDEDDFLHSARPSSTATEGGTSSKGKRSLDDMMDIGGSTRKSTNKRWKDSISGAVETMSASISEKIERRKAREDDSAMSKAAGNPSTMTNCMTILLKMSGVSPDAINSAFQQFAASAELREGFLLMTPEMQLHFVSSCK